MESILSLLLEIAAGRARARITGRRPHRPPPPLPTPCLLPAFPLKVININAAFFLSRSVLLVVTVFEASA